MMWSTKTRAVVIGGVATVLIGGAATAGGVAAAHASGTTPSATSTSTPSSGSTATTGAKHAGKGKKDAADAIARLRNGQHAQWVAKDKSGAFVTHDAIHGTVTSASATSVTVKAGDGVSQTYALTGTTKVVLGHGKASKPTVGSASDLKQGATVLVTGTGTSGFTADRVVVPAS